MIKLLDCKKKKYFSKINKLLLKRKLVSSANKNLVDKIIQDIKKKGDKELIKYEKKYSKNKEIFINKNLIPLFHMIKYNDLISLIKSKIKNKKNISFKYIKEETNLLNLMNKKKSELIINCESSNILTRRYLKNAVHKNYYNKAFTTLINHKKIKNNKAIQIFTKYGPIAFLPLSDELTSIVFSFELKKKKKTIKIFLFIYFSLLIKKLSLKTGPACDFPHIGSAFIFNFFALGTFSSY